MKCHVQHRTVFLFFNNGACLTLKFYWRKISKEIFLVESKLFVQRHTFVNMYLEPFALFIFTYNIVSKLIFVRCFLVAGRLHVFEWCIITSTFCIKSYFQIISAHMSVICFVILHLVTCAIVSRLGCKLVLTYEVSRDLANHHWSLFVYFYYETIFPTTT